jgi:hypothetical protein
LGSSTTTKRVIETVGEFDRGDAAGRDDRVNAERAIGIELTDQIEHDRHRAAPREIGVDDRDGAARTLERADRFES